MKAYSIDLRREIVNAYEQREGSQRALAKRFEVSPNFVGTVIKRHQTEGTLAFKPPTGGFAPKLATQLNVVQHLIEQNSDATLKELCTQIEQKTQIRVSPSTLCRTLKRLKISS
jgi:transposase